MSTKISVIIPCYNAENWIEKCVNSALDQSYKNTEVIVVDNESTDNSLKIIKKISEKNDNLIVSTAPNLYRHSWTEPVEEALTLADGEYFTIVGADDCLEKKYIENISRILEKSNYKIELLQSPIRGIDSEDNIKQPDISHKYNNLLEFKKKLFNGCPVNTPTVVYKRKLHNDGDIFWDSESYLGAADYNLYFHLAEKEKFIYPFPMWLGYYYRWHAGQSTWGMQKESTRYDDKIKSRWSKAWEE